MKQIVLPFFFSVCMLSGKAATVYEHLYITADSLELVDGVKIPHATFSGSPVFSPKNHRILLNVGDQLDLWVHNLDSIEHEFAVYQLTGNQLIAPGDSIQVIQTFSNPGLHIYHDPKNFPDYTSLGLGGMIVVKDHNHASFYWNIKEHALGSNSTILNGGTVNWGDYNPDYFTLNGRSNPEINNDVDARVTGNVGDTLMIYVANTGQSIHSLHFHGYHVKVVYASDHSFRVGWMKDTQPVSAMEGLILELIPDQSGEYPVHDHNLVATTGGNVYPYGMFTTLLIDP